MTSTPSAPTVNYNPQPGTGETYIPQNQPSADYNYISLLENLMSQYTTSGTPGQQQYPLASGLARTYANEANAPTWEDYINRVNYNPYYDQALAAANTAAGYGAGAGSTQYNTYENTLAGIPQSQADLAAKIAGTAPSIANLAATTSTYAPQAISDAAKTIELAPVAVGQQPEYAALADVAKNLQPEFAALANVAKNLQPEFSSLAGVAKNLQPEFSSLAGVAKNLQPEFKSMADYVKNLAPGVQALSTGVSSTIPAVTDLAKTVAGTLPQYQAAANRALSYIPEVQRQQDFLTGLESIPTGAGSLRDAASKLLTTGFDPQNALFNQLTQQTRDQANAINAASGLAGSPYASGLTSDALRNLDIQWQNQQLSREAAATAGAGGALAQASGLTQDQAKLAQDVQNAIAMKTGLSTQSLADLTAMGGQATAAGGLYGTAGSLANIAAGITGEAGNLMTQAGGLDTAGINALLASGTLDTQGINALTASGALDTQGINALTASGSLDTSGVNALTAAGNLRTGGINALTAGGNLYTSGTGQLTAAGGLNTAAGGLYGLSGNEYANAASTYGLAPSSALTNQNLINNLVNTTASAGALPSNTYLGNIQSEMAARNAQLNALSGATGQAAAAANVGNTQYNMIQNVLSDLINYLITGQNATKTGVSSGLAGTSQDQASLAGLAGLGTLGSNALFGSGGLTGLLGGNSQTGLLGVLKGLLAGGGGGTSLVNPAEAALPFFG